MPPQSYVLCRRECPVTDQWLITDLTMLVTKLHISLKKTHLVYCQLVAPNHWSTTLGALNKPLQTHEATPATSSFRPRVLDGCQGSARGPNWGPRPLWTEESKVVSSKIFASFFLVRKHMFYFFDVSTSDFGWCCGMQMKSYIHTIPLSHWLT